MSIKGVLVDVGVLTLVAAVGLGVGLAKGYKAGSAIQLRNDNPKIDAAEQAAKTAQKNARVLAGSLADIQQRLDTERQTLLAAQQAAQLALAQRDTARVALAKAERARITLDRTIAHDTPDCAALARLPVCPALARQLFPAAGQASAAADHRAVSH